MIRNQRGLARASALTECLLAEVFPRLKDDKSDGAKHRVAFTSSNVPNAGTPSHRAAGTLQEPKPKPASQTSLAIDARGSEAHEKVDDVMPPDPNGSDQFKEKREETRLIAAADVWYSPRIIQNNGQAFGFVQMSQKSGKSLHAASSWMKACLAGKLYGRQWEAIDGL